MQKKAFYLKQLFAFIIIPVLFLTLVPALYAYAEPAVTYGFETVQEISKLPVINISTENGEGPDKTDKDTKTYAGFEIKNSAADIKLSVENQTIDGNEFPVWPLTLEGRGHSSWNINTEKKSYNLCFSSKQDLLGLGRHREWCLVSNWLDTSHIRNYIALKLGALLDVCAMNCEFVELCINGRYEGLYLLTEKHSLSNGSIKTVGDGWDVDGDGMICKYLIEASSAAETDEKSNSFQTGSGVWFVVKEPDKGSFLSEADPKLLYIQDLVTKADQAIMTGGDFELYIDLDSFIDVYILQELTKNPDFGFGYQPVYASTFLYAEEGGKLFSGPVWDFDLSMGRTNYGPQAAEFYRDTLNPQGFLHKNTKWLAELFNSPVFEQRVKGRWSELRPVLEDSVSSLCARLPELLRPSASMDCMTWGLASLHTGGWELRVPLGFADECAYVESFLAQRIEWLDSQWSMEEPVAEEPSASYNIMLIIPAALLLMFAAAYMFRRKKRSSK